MADNVTLDVMTGGSTVATDEISSVHHQLVKVEFGPDGAGTMVSESNPLPVAGYAPGTITSGSVSVIAGTIGTVANVAQVHNAGTINALPNIPGGTIGQVTNGTIRVTAGTVAVNTPGTITSGTITKNPRTTVNLLTRGSVWGTSSGTAGTMISAPGTSNVLLINEISISNEGTSTLTAGMSFGTAQQGTANIVRVAMAGNGGIQKSFPIPVGGSHPNLPLVIWTSGSGTASFNVSYWTEAQ